MKSISKATEILICGNTGANMGGKNVFWPVRLPGKQRWLPAGETDGKKPRLVSVNTGRHHFVFLR